MRRPLIISLVLAVVAAFIAFWGWSMTQRFRDFLRPDIPYPTISPRPGMEPVSFSYFGFGVPAEWDDDNAGGPTTTWSDSAGRVAMSADVSTILKCPDRTRPDPLPDGMAGRKLRLGKAVPLTVPGAAGGWRYDVTGPGGPNPADGDQTMVRVWLANCEKQLNMNIYAAPGVADRIVATLIARERR
jgi:hypothetical protein